MKKGGTLQEEARQNERRKGTLLSGLRLFLIGAGIGSSQVLFSFAAKADPTAVSGSWAEPTLSFYGDAGMIDMPGAFAMNDGDLSMTLQNFGATSRVALHFQITPRLSGAARYSILQDGFTLPGREYYDRSFDLRYQLAEEGPRMPAIAVGLRDFGGTGIYSSEYIAFGKTFGRLRASGGIGWGRLGSRNGFDNPLGTFSDKLKTRGGVSGLSETGQVDFGNWFRGDAAFFGGLQYQVHDRLVLTAEYSSDSYSEELARDNSSKTYDSPFNFGATYRMANGVDLSAAWLYGTDLGVMVNYTFNPQNPPGPDQGREGAGPQVVPRSAAPLGWEDLATSTNGVALSPEGAARAQLAAQGIDMLSYARHGNGVQLHIRNQRYAAEAQAIGRAARALTAVLPRGVETMTLVSVRNGVSTVAVTLDRADLEALENDLEGSWKSYARASIKDGAAYPLRGNPARTGYPRLSYALSPYWGPTRSNPDSPLAQGGLRFGASYEPTPGLVLSTELRQKLIDTGTGPTPTGNGAPGLVRRDAGLYDERDDLELRQLQLDYFVRPAQAFYGRFTVGMLEQMYGGISGEVLWQPVFGSLALGAEVNYVHKRSLDDAFGLEAQDAVTAFASAYYDFGGGYRGQLDVGRYLAGDIGGTVTFTREFANGFTLGAFVTLTDMSKEEFGEGSFDKGIMFSIPATWFLGTPSRREASMTLRPLRGEGGARVGVSTRLYEMIHDSQGNALAADWGRFWR